jgi:small GTP-binding protein
MKIIIVGPGRVGKTACCNMLIDEKYSKDYKLTIGCSFYTYDCTINDTDCRFSLWELAGQDRFGPVRKTFYSDSVGLILMVDLTRPETLESAEAYIREEIIPCCKDIPLRCAAVVGNKEDLEDQIKITDEELNKLAKTLESALSVTTLCLKTSAKILERTKNMFYCLFRCILER